MAPARHDSARAVPAFATFPAALPRPAVRAANQLMIDRNTALMRSSTTILSQLSVPIARGAPGQGLGTGGDQAAASPPDPGPAQPPARSAPRGLLGQRPHHDGYRD